jgi:hypothetical protein
MKKSLWILLLAIIAVMGAMVYILLTGFAKKDGIKKETIPERAAPAGYATDITGFNDGLGLPNSVINYRLDEYGEGLASIEIFNMDINGDNKPDRITRARHENGTSHFYYEYKIELSDGGKFANITPDGFRTVESADCSLQKLQFAFRPEFHVVKISRQWEESWTHPTMAVKTVYNIANDELKASQPRQMKSICNVADLF